MTTLEEMSPRVEIYSIDAFATWTGVRNCRDLTEFGKEICAMVLKRTHLTVGVGIAQTKHSLSSQTTPPRNGRGRRAELLIVHIDRQSAIIIVPA